MRPDEIGTSKWKRKRRKAAGPDCIANDLIMELGTEGLEAIEDIFNQWWYNEDMPEEILRAKLMMLHKKGNISDFSAQHIMQNVRRYF